MTVNRQLKRHDRDGAVCRIFFPPFVASILFLFFGLELKHESRDNVLIVWTLSLQCSAGERVQQHALSFQGQTARWGGVFLSFAQSYTAFSPLPSCFANGPCLFCAATGEKMVKDIRPGVAFEPTYIYKLLMLIKSSLSEKVKGFLWWRTLGLWSGLEPKRLVGWENEPPSRPEHLTWRVCDEMSSQRWDRRFMACLLSQGRQEDAEEYLGFTLNGLHEEMLALKKLISPSEDSAFTSPSLCLFVRFCFFLFFFIKYK